MATRGRPSKQGTPFDRLIKLQCQKAVASKSTSGVVGKWSSFSRPSMMSSSSAGGDLKRGLAPAGGSDGAPKPKKFFKSRDSTAATNADEDVDFTETVLSQAIPNQKPKPTEPKATTQHYEKPASKFFSSKQKVKPVEAPQVNSSRRVAAGRSTRKNYAESDSEDSPVAPPVAVAAPHTTAPAVATKSSKQYVSKGKPAATLFHQQQQQQEESRRRRGRPSRTSQTSVSKATRNSEESDATEESSADDDQQVDNVGLNGSDNDSNGHLSDSGSLPDTTSPIIPEEPPIKMAPIKLIIKTSQISPPKESSTTSSRDMEDSRATRRGTRTRFRSDTSENEPLQVAKVDPEKKGRHRKKSDAEPKVVSTRTRSQSNSHHETDVKHEPEKRLLTPPAIESIEEVPVPAAVEKVVDINNDDDADLSTRRHYSRTRNNGSIRQKNSNNNALTPEGNGLTQSEPSPAVHARSKALEKIPEEEVEETKKVVAPSEEIVHEPISVDRPKKRLIVPQVASATNDTKRSDASVKSSSQDLDSVPESVEVASVTRSRTIASSFNVSSELKIKDLASSSSQPSSSSLPKRSIFKSKTVTGQSTSSGGSNGGNGNKKGLSLYKHKWNTNTEQDDFRSEVIKRVLTGAGDPSVVAKASPFDDDFDGPDDALPAAGNFATSKLVRVTSDATDDKEIVSVKCPKAQKEYFTVIKNVKKAHQIQDSGEFQEFNDDVDYILGGLGSKNSLSTRCLSTVTLAVKCMEAPFRMHLRAHGTVTQFFKELKDAPQNPSLALCAATVLFVLSQDRLNMDLDRDSLELMLNLLDTDSRIKDALDHSGLKEMELKKNKQKVEDLCAEMKKKGHAVNLSLEHISADHLSMETLLSLTSKRAGEWFKEELRELGGLDHLVNTMSDCVTFLTVEEISLWTEPLHNKLKKVGRVLKVLESVTSENEENCDYLLEYEGGRFLRIIHKLFKFLDEEVPLNACTDINDRDSVGQTLRESLFDVIRLYINLVHDFRHLPKGSLLACKQADDMFDIALHCLFVLPASLPVEKRFDIHVLILTFIINLVENAEENRAKLMKAYVPQKADALFSAAEKQLAIEAMVELFLQNEENARNEESKTDQILDGVNPEEEEKKKKDGATGEAEKKSREEVIDETVAQLLHKAGRHMEDTLIASYITLIIGYLILESKENELEVRRLLPDNNFVLMVTVLKKFFNFMNLTASATVTSSRGIKATETILKYLEKIDKVEEKSEAKTDEDNFDDVTLFDVSNDEGDATNIQSSPAADDAFDMTFHDDFGKL